MAKQMGGLEPINGQEAGYILDKSPGPLLFGTVILSKQAILYNNMDVWSEETTDRSV